VPKFKYLLSPIRVGNVIWKNRMFKSGAGSAMMIDNGGHVTEVGKQYYFSFAKGGIGCVFVECPNIDDPLGHRMAGDFRIDDDKFLPGFVELVEGIHKHGAKAFVQLYHAGPWHLGEFSGLKPVAASPHAEPEMKAFEQIHECEELTIEKIEIITEKFISAAERAQTAGFDGVEINCAGAHLLGTFLCRYWNYRHDEYGCDSLENRARFTVDIVKGIKARCGKDFSVAVLMNGTEYNMGDLGTTRGECVEFAKIFEAAGADALQVRSFQHENMTTHWPEHYFYPEKKDNLPEGMDFSHRGPGAFIPDAFAVKQAVSIPVFVPGKWDGDLEHAEDCIRKGKIDAIGITRALNADPELPNKLLEGRIHEIRPCTSCLTCVEGHQIPNPIYTYCRINPFMGKDKEYECYPEAEKKKKVLIAGGGPSGMEAARVSALRGHNVILYSGDSFLGGLMAMAAVVKGDYPENIESIIKWYKLQLEKLGVKVVLGRKVSAEIVDKHRPDAVVIATGAVPFEREMPGCNSKKVISSEQLRSKLNIALKISKPNRVSKGSRVWMPLGKTVVVMGGDIKGIQLATFLFKRGRKVTIVEESEILGQGMNFLHMWIQCQWLAQKGVILMPGVRYEEINSRGLVITTSDGQKQCLEADSIIPMMPLEADHHLLKVLENKVSEVHACGSCVNPGLIRDAVNEGFRVGFAL